MKIIDTIVRINHRHISILLLLLATTSCTVRLLPEYDASLAEQIEVTARKIELFYLTLLENNEEKGAKATYQSCKDQYIDIEADLSLMLLKNKTKELNKHSVRICEITLEVWQKYKNEHKKNNTLSNAVIDLNKEYMSELFLAMQHAEKAKDIIKNENN